MNLFHLKSRNPPEEIFAVIEVPMGSKNKYEYNFISGFMELERVSHSSFVSPLNYGFVPRTWTQEGAPLDILVLSQSPIHTGTVASVYPIGYLDVIANGKKDPKVLSVVKRDPHYNHLEDIDGIAPNILNEISHFFNRYRELEKRDIKVREWYGREETEKILDNAFRDYEEKF